MGLETALIGGTLIGAGANIIGGNKAAKAQARAANQATDLQREQLQIGLETTEPFRTAGASVLPGLTALTNQPVERFAFRDPGKFLSQYYQSPEFQALSAQAEDTLLRNQAATGGFRSGATQVGLGQIAPLLGIQALERQNQQDLTAYGTNQGALADQFQRLYGLGSLGANIATGNANMGTNFASQAGQNAIAAGNARAANYMNTAGAIGGLAKDYSGLRIAQAIDKTYAPQDRIF